MLASICCVAVSYTQLRPPGTRAEGERAMAELARESFAAPGDSKWILGAFFPTAASQAQAEAARPRNLGG